MAVESTENQVTKFNSSVEKNELLKKFKMDRLAWINDCPLVGTHIHIYFHRSRRNIPEYWENYYKLINQFCELTEEDDEKKRKCILTNINYFIGKVNSRRINKISENVISEILPNRSHTNYKEKWQDLKQKIFDLKHELMQHIIESNMAGFSRGLNFK